MSREEPSKLRQMEGECVSPQEKERLTRITEEYQELQRRQQERKQDREFLKFVPEGQAQVEEALYDPRAILDEANRRVTAAEEMEVELLKKAQQLFPEGRKATSEQADCLKKPLKEQEGGMRFNKGKRQWGLLNYKALEPMIKVLEFGAEKYGAWNWQKGLSKREILESMQRHIAAMMDGEENDPESGLPHIGHIGCNFLFYSYFTTVDSSHARP